MSNRFKILSIDGGGIKGLYSAQVLAIMEQRFGCLLSDKFDLICGTSTGAILALAIALKISMNDAVEFYEKEGPKIFQEKFKKIPGYGLYLAVRQSLFSSKYNSKNLELALNEVFKSQTMKDCQNMVCIPAININDSSCCIFKKDYGSNGRDNNKRCVDVALASAAAPTYFPVKEIDDRQYADGGLYSNNPTLVGLIEYIYKVLPQFPEKGYNGVDILSVSSCEIPHGLKCGRLNKSFWNWKSYLFDAYSQGQAQLESFLLDQITQHLDFDVTYYRVKNAPLPPDTVKLIDLDNASAKALKALKAVGKTTGDNECAKENVRYFFKTSKTINI